MTRRRVRLSAVYDTQRQCRSERPAALAGARWCRTVSACPGSNSSLWTRRSSLPRPSGSSNVRDRAAGQRGVGGARSRPAVSFCRSLRGARWTSSRPFGVGATRSMPALFGALVVDERYFRWEEGRRQCSVSSVRACRCSSASPRTTSSTDRWTDHARRTGGRVRNVDRARRLVGDVATRSTSRRRPQSCTAPARSSTRSSCGRSSRSASDARRRSCHERRDPPATRVNGLRG
jgi:hypothetical protein